MFSEKEQEFVHKIYKITNIKNNKSYIGLAIKNNTLERFKKHVAGKGAFYIKKDIDAKLYTSEDFQYAIFASLVSNISQYV